MDKSIKNLRGKAFSGLIWKLSERIAAQLISFLVQLVLARLLMPEAFGVIAIVNVLIAIFNVLITDGLGTSLINKKDADNKDFSSVLIFNMFFSAFLYGIIFLSAPLIAGFYKMPTLLPIIRILGLQVILSGIKTVQQAYVARNFKFRLFFWMTFIGTIISGVVGVIMAYSNCGVWSLVAQHLVNSTIDVFFLAVTIGWKPQIFFSWSRMKPLISYGWKLLVSGLIDTLFNNIRALIIGKKYSSSDLAYYNRGKQFPDLISDNLTSSISSVLFPVMSAVQSEKDKVKQITRRFIRICSYVTAPCFIGIAVVSRNLVSLLLTDKWLFCVPYIWIFCATGLMRPLQTANQQMIKAIGRSDITVKTEIIKKAVCLSILLIFMNYGVLWIALSGIIYTSFAFIVNAFPSKKLIGYGYLEQIKDVLPSLISAIAMAIPVYLISLLKIGNLATIVIQVILGASLYLLISKVFKLDAYFYLKTLIKDKFKRKPAADN